jgi:hypothetical protein
VTVLRPMGILLVAGCAADPGPLDAPPAPVINDVVVAPAAVNVLSAIVEVSAQHTDSARVRFGTVASGAIDSTAPGVLLQNGSASIPVLGLLPSTEYALQVTAFGAGGTATRDPVHFTTAALPTDLPSYTAAGSEPTAGYVVFAAAGYGLAIENTGRVVWYVRLADPATLNFQPQPTGRYYTRPTTPVTPVPWQEIDPLGNVTRTLGCARGLIARFHDIIALADGSYWIMCDETRVMDLTSFGGQIDARVTGTVVQHIDAGQQPLFEWSVFDHFSIDDLDPADRTGPTVNFTHGNAIDLDRNGNLLISFRSLSEITSVSTRTGVVLWRMGGRANQFTFTDMPAFRSQHGLRGGPTGSLVLLDNLGDPATSQAEQVQVDEVAYTVRIGGTAAPAPLTVAQLGGTTQPLPAGRLLVAFGNGNRVQEFDAGGEIVWEIQGNSGYVFRATRIRSLYNPGYGLTR